MARQSGRFRVTVATMMAFIAVTALFIAVVLPLVRHGKPSCLTSVQTAQWLFTSLGKASCTDCHANPAGTDRRQALAALPAAANTCPVAQSGQGSTSCMACHATPRGAPKLAPSD
jgi:hypothetical protein